MLYSFDIFDTLITRRTATPSGIFALMQHRLQTDAGYQGISYEIRNRFYDLRVGAESLARAYFIRAGVEEVTLPEIYKAMASTGDLDEDDIDQLMKLEKETELQNIIGIDENIIKLKKLQEEGNRVVLISDMYLDEKTIRTLLKAVDCVFDDIPLYVSSAWRKCKWTGSLYELVRRKEQASYRDWCHTGDNEQSDVEVPKHFKIQAEHYAFEPLWGVEHKGLKKTADDPAVQLAIGTARNLRLQHREWGNPATVGASIGGPILVPYVQWVLRCSQEIGLHRLYFIARDGYVLKMIADIIIAKQKLQIETHYIYGSRRTWRMPGYDGSEENLKKILSYARLAISSKAKVVADIADVLEISMEEIKPFLPKFWPDVRIPLYSETYNWLILYLSKQNDFRRFLKNKHFGARDLALNYLCQEVGFLTSDFAFVELAGTGFTSECMVSIIRDVYKMPIHIFYYNLFGDGIDGRALYHNFLPQSLPHTMLLELLCRAMHGQTVSYSRTNNRINAIVDCSDKESSVLKNYGYEEYLSAVDRFANIYVDYFHHCDYMSAEKMSHDYLDNIGNNPDENVLAYLSEMPFDDTGYSAKIKKFAPRLTRRDIRDLFLFNPDYSHYNGSDLNYSLLRCDAWETNKISWYQHNRGLIIKRFKKILGRDLIQEKDIYAPFKDFPFRVLGEKIVIYGAGVFGKRLYSEVEKSGCDIVGWLDRNYIKLQEEGLPVTGMSKDLKGLDFDVVWIAVLNHWVIDEIKKEMINDGIPEEKIMYFGKWVL